MIFRKKNPPDECGVKARGKKLNLSEDRLGRLFAGIPLLGFLIFGLTPLIFSIFLCFNQFKGLRINTGTFVGLQNFASIFKDKLFWTSLYNTLYVVIAVVISLALALFISVLLATNVKFAKVFKVVYFIPYVCSMVAITFMWKWIFDYNSGVLNTVLLNLGWISEKINWLNNTEYYRAAMMVLLVWSGTGFDIILFSAALTSVKRSQYEAAEIDGCGPIKKFFYITFPAISPTTFYLFIMGIIGALQEFTRFQVMSPTGGPDYKGMTLGFYLYRTLFPDGGGADLGKASAIGWVIALLITIVTVINFKLSKKWVSYD